MTAAAAAKRRRDATASELRSMINGYRIDSNGAFPFIRRRRHPPASSQFAFRAAIGEQTTVMNYKTSKCAAYAAALFTLVRFAMAAPNSARAADYCITNGAQAAHGCGFPSIEACRATSAGIGGTCSPNGASETNNSGAHTIFNSRAYMTFQPNRPPSRLRHRARGY